MVIIKLTTITMNFEKSILELILPEGIFEWFDIAGGDKDEKDLKTSPSQIFLSEVDAHCLPLGADTGRLKVRKNY